MTDYSMRKAGSAAAVVGAALSVMLASGSIAQGQTPPAAPPATKPAAPPAARPAQPPAAKPPAGAPAAPADKGAAALPPAELQPGQPNPWVKLCSKDPQQREICLIAQELRTQDGQVVASVALREISGDPKKMLLIAVPPLHLIQPGLRVGVDKGKPEEGKYTICFANACYAEMQVTDPFVNSMKTGRVLVVTTLNLQEKPDGFPLGLAGFKAAYEGPGIDPTKPIADPAQPSAELQDALKKRAEEASKKLQDAPKSQ